MSAISCWTGAGSISSMGCSNTGKYRTVRGVRRSAGLHKPRGCLPSVPPAPVGHSIATLHTVWVQGCVLRAGKGQLYYLLWLEVCSSPTLPCVFPTFSFVDKHSLCCGIAWELSASCKSLSFSLSGDIRNLLKWIKQNLLKERPELFMQGESVRPGISGKPSAHSWNQRQQTYLHSDLLETGIKYPGAATKIDVVAFPSVTQEMFQNTIQTSLILFLVSYPQKYPIPFQ